MSDELSTDGFKERLGRLINDHFRENISAFSRKCEEIGGKSAPSHGMILKYLKGSEPGRDKLVVMARAAGVSVGWLAAGEDTREDRRPLNNSREVPRRGTRYAGPEEIFPAPEEEGESESVKVEGGPPTPSHKYPLWAVESMGHRVLSVTLDVTGMPEPIKIPINVLQGQTDV